MNIFVESGSYKLQNVGDIAMLQVAVRRLQSQIVDADVRVVCCNAEELPRYVRAQSFHARGIDHWHNSRVLPIPRSWMPRFVQDSYDKLEEGLRRTFPVPACASMGLVARLRSRSFAAEKEYFETIRKSEWVVAIGGGYLNDCFPRHTRRLLLMLELAQACGCRTAMFGQGIGPLEDKELRGLASMVLPGVEFIGVREGRASPQLLAELGVDPSRVTCTGDDAIELATTNAPQEIGAALGVGLRVAGYSELKETELGVVGRTLRNWWSGRKPPVLPIPISFHEGDLEHVRRLLSDHEIRHCTESVEKSPICVVNRVGRCRLVVTGTYHAGVFALAQGIPVVCLSSSEYYNDKLMGLAEQFQVGCEVIDLRLPNVEDALGAALEQLWQSAEELRPILLQHAQRQVAAGLSLYSQISNGHPV